MPVIVTWQNGAPVRSPTSPRSIDSVENDKVRAGSTARAPSCSPSSASPTPTPSRWSTGSEAMLPADPAELPTGVEIKRAARPLDLDPARDRRRPVHAAADHRAGRPGDLFLPAQLAGDADPGHRPADLDHRHVRRHVSSATRSTTSRCWRSRSRRLRRRRRHRHAREHRPPRRGGHEADRGGLKGAGEIGFTIISITLSLVAVFIPVLFMGGVVGRMFNEFGLVVTFAILISASSR